MPERSSHRPHSLRGLKDSGAPRLLPLPTASSSSNAKSCDAFLHPVLWGCVRSHSPAVSALQGKEGFLSCRATCLRRQPNTQPKGESKIIFSLLAASCLPPLPPPPPTGVSMQGIKGCSGNEGKVLLTHCSPGKEGVCIVWLRDSLRSEGEATRCSKPSWEVAAPPPQSFLIPFSPGMSTGVARGKKKKKKDWKS